MKYRGFIIVPVYYIGSDFKIRNGRVEERKQTSKDVDYYSIQDPMNDYRQHCGADSIKEAKQEIDRLLDTILFMKDNSPESWSKLDNQTS